MSRRCVHLDGCTDDATQVVNSQPMCDAHAAQEIAETERDRARVAAWMSTPEALAAAVAERELEGRVS